MSNPNPWGAGRGPEQPSSISTRGVIVVIVAIAVVAFIGFYVFSR
jgi:hypothetical protein